MNIFEIPVHQAADIFPMIAADDLAELAQDIAENGLVHPVVVKDGVLIDGRNRREACFMVGVEPDWIEFEGDNVEAYIISSNINRRHMTKGQQAMAVAMVYPETKQGKKQTSELSSEVSGRYINKARTVIRHLPDEANMVLAGGLMLNEAYKLAISKRDESTSWDARFAAIQNELPETAELIKEGKISLEAGEAEIKNLRDAEAARQNGFDRWLKDINQMAMTLSCDLNAVNRKVDDFTVLQISDDTFAKRSDAIKMMVEYRDNLDKLIKEISK